MTVYTSMMERTCTAYVLYSMLVVYTADVRKKIFPTSFFEIDIFDGGQRTTRMNPPCSSFRTRRMSLPNVCHRTRCEDGTTTSTSLDESETYKKLGCTCENYILYQQVVVQAAGSAYCRTIRHEYIKYTNNVERITRCGPLVHHRVQCSFRPPSQNLLTSRLDECMRFAFMNLLNSEKVFAGQDSMDPHHFLAMSDMYSEIRKQKRDRERILELLVSCIANVRKADLFSKFGPEIADNPKPIQGKLTEHLPEAKNWSSKCLHRFLWVQFVSCVIGSLPFLYESEVLFVIYHISRFMSLYTDACVSQYDAEKDAGEESDNVEIFSITASSIALQCLKSNLKQEFAITTERCQAYEPNETRIEKVGGEFQTVVACFCKTLFLQSPRLLPASRGVLAGVL